MTNLTHQTLGKYRLVAQLGRGGMAEVYKAYQPNLDRYVAIKVLHSHLASEGDFIARFEREAAAIARLRHPNIIQVHDFEAANGLYYMVMEFIEGPTLKTELAARQAQSTPLSLADVVHIFSALASATDYAHSRGIIHRDIKPSNIILTLERQVVLTDFGITYILGSSQTTATGTVSGTPDYMSPEQAQGERGNNLSDIYSLGVVLYEMVTGRVPFVGDTPFATMMKHVHAALPAPSTLRPDLPAEFERIMLKLTHKDPAERYQTATEAAQDLRSFVGLEVVDLGEGLPIDILAPAQLDTTPTGRTGTTTLVRPYRGLFAFQEDNAPFFFGRETFTERLATAVQQQQFAAIIGPSGSGKSSVVFAGLVPRLKRQTALALNAEATTNTEWLVVDLRPSSRPFQALAAALLAQLEPALSETDRLLEVNKLAEALQAGQLPLYDVVLRLLSKTQTAHMLLVLDQFEELFTLCPEPEVKRRFPAVLLAALEQQRTTGTAPNLAVVLTLRADFMGQALADRALADVFQTAAVPLGPMTRQELFHAIANPATRLSVAFEAGLVERILNDVGDEPGNLPLLEFALTLLWDRRVGRRLTHTAYETIGRVAGALASYADEIFGALNAADQEAARRLFVQMVRPGEGTEDTRRIAHRAELGAAEWLLAQRLANARLVVTGHDPATGQETVEVVHEALIRSWTQLRSWMTADRVFRTWQERLRAVLRQWETSHRDEDALLRGTLLAEAEDWLHARADELTTPEREFIQASLALRERQLAEREAQRQRELEATRRLAEAEKRRAEEQSRVAGQLRGWAWVLSGALVIAAVLALVALNFSNQANANAQQANLNLSTAQAANTLAVAQQATAEAEAHSRATAEANALAQKAEAEQQRLTAQARQFAAQAAIFRGSQPDLALLLSLQANRLQDSVETRSSLLASLQTNEQILIYLRNEPNLIMSVAFSPDGAQVAMVGGQGVVRLWDLTANPPVSRTLVGHDPAQLVNDVAFSPDGMLLATSSDDSSVIVWEVATGQPRYHITDFKDFVQTLAFSPNGRLLATGGGERVVRLWEVASGRPVGQPLQGHANRVWSLAFSADGNWLASGDDRGELRLWDTALLPASEGETAALDLAAQVPALGEPATVINTNTVSSLAFHPVLPLLATGSANGTVELWQLPGLEPVGEPWAGHVAGIHSIAFSPDGRTLASASQDGSIRLWPMELAALPTEPPQNVQVLVGSSSDMRAVAYNAANTLLVSGSSNGLVLIWDISFERGLNTTPLAAHAGYISKVGLGPTESVIFSSGQDGVVRLWDLAQLPSHLTAETLVPLERPLGDVDASAPNANEVEVTSTAKLLATPSYTFTHANWLTPSITSLTYFSPTLLVAGRADGSVAFWDTTTGQASPIGLKLSGREELFVDPYPFQAHATGPVIVTYAAERWAMGSLGGGIRVGSPQAQRFLFGHTAQVSALAYAPNLVTLASADVAGVVRVWNAITYDALGVLYTDTVPVQALVFHPTEPWLVVGNAAGELAVWDAAARTRLATLPAHQSAVLGLAFSPSGQQLLSVAADGSLGMWEAATLNTALTPTATLAWNAPAGTVVAWALDAASAQLVLGYADGALWRLALAPNWDAVTVVGGSAWTHVPPRLTSLAFASDGQTLSVGHADGQVRQIALADAALTTLQRQLPALVTLYDAELSPDGQLLATGGEDGLLRLWPLAEAQLPPKAFTHTSAVRSLAFSPDSQLLASTTCGSFQERIGCTQGQVLFWDVASGQLLLTLPAQAGFIREVAFAPDGRWFATAGCGTLDPLGTCTQGSVWLWDVTELRAGRVVSLTAPLAVHATLAVALAFSPDGQWLVSGGADAQAALWDLRPLRAGTGGPTVRMLAGAIQQVSAVAFSPDSQILATGGCGRFQQRQCVQGGVRLWDTHSGQLLGGTLLGHDALVYALAFDATGQTLVSGGLDGQLLAWNLDVAAWRARACYTLNRDFTLDEWQLYMGEVPYQALCGK